MTALMPRTAGTAIQPSRRRRVLLVTALSISLAGGVLGSSGVAAQDGTAAATPTPPSACKLVPVSENDFSEPASASPAAGSTTTPAASPVASSVGGATPVASPSASPVSLDLDEPESDPLAENIETAATAIAGCLSDGNYETLATITSDLYRGQLFGTDAPMDAATFGELAPMLPQVAYQILSVDEVQLEVDLDVTALVTYEMAHQVRTSTWTFTQQEIGGETAWVLASETPAEVTVPEGTVSIAVTMQNNAYTLDTDTVDGNAVALKATNADSVDHEMLVLRFADGVTSGTLLEAAGPTLPQGVQFIGQATISAGSEGTLLLNGLQPGTYTIVCLLPDADGTPDLAKGMETTITVR